MTTTHPPQPVRTFADLARRHPAASVYVVLVDLAAICVVAVSFLHLHITVVEVKRSAFIASLSIAYSLLAWRSDTVRCLLAHNRSPNLVGVWVSAAILSLNSAPLVAGVAIVACVGDWLPRRAIGVPAHQHIFSGSLTIATSTTIALAPLAGLGTLVVAASRGDLLTAMLVAIVYCLTGQHRNVPRMFGAWQNHSLELACFGLGYACAEMIDYSVPGTWICLPVALGLQYLAARDEVLRHVSRRGLVGYQAWLIIAGGIVDDDRDAAVMQIHVDGDIRRAARTVGQSLERNVDYMCRRGPDLFIVSPEVGQDTDRVARWYSQEMANLAVVATVTIATRHYGGRNLPDLLKIIEAEQVIAAEMASVAQPV